MQFHLNGFEPGDPHVIDRSQRQVHPGTAGPLPSEVDVLIVGCGPAGLTLAAQLSAFPDIKTCIIEQKPGPLLLGQADGVACRTVEMFEAFGFAERVVKEACWINETTFWKPDSLHPGHIVRSGRVQDTEEGLSEFPHVVLNQARVHDFYLEIMRQSAAPLVPFYSRRLLDLDVDTSPSCTDDHRVTIRVERSDAEHEGQVETIKARYVVGCDGARSSVRKSIGRALDGDSANHAWGVMDVLAVTDFPDVRFKSVIQSDKHGSVLIIPREGGYLFRLYIEMDKLDEGERVAALQITADDLIAAAKRVLTPYTLDVKEIAWWSVYEIGQRLCDKFDDVPDGDAQRPPRVFIAGDACHTHSPKAGQGMNVSMQDGFNLGWKLASVLRGRSAPSLLRSYSEERQTVAKELIDFDREWARVISSSDKHGEAASKTQDYFVQHGRYTAGTATRYQPSLLTGDAAHQSLATGLTVGMRFHSAPVIRITDAKPLHLGHVIKADGRWRIFAFAGEGDLLQPDSPVHNLCAFLNADTRSPVRRYTPTDSDIDSVIDLRVIVQTWNELLSLEALPQLLLPRKGRYGLRDYEKLFRADRREGNDIFTQRGIDRARGCVVIVRPDQYIADVMPLHMHGRLAAYFDGILLKPE